MAQYTFAEFQKDYPNDAACLDKMFKLRFGDNKTCSSCGQETQFKRITTRRSYQCRLCYYQIYPTAGTPIEKTRTPLNYWFFVMYLMTTTRNGVAAKEVQRALGVTYKTAFKMCKSVREIMGHTVVNRQLTGNVEMDETFLKSSKRDHNKGRPIEIGKTYTVDKKPRSETHVTIFGMVERLGDVRAFHVKSKHSPVINPIILANVDKNAQVSTDESPLYHGLRSMGFGKHETINHGNEEWRRGVVCTNTIEGFFGQFKRMITGTHIHISDKYVQNYLNEAVFRYNNRGKDIDMFGTLLAKISDYKA